MGKRAEWNWQWTNQKATRWADLQEYIPRECIALPERPLASITGWLALATGIYFLRPGGQESEMKCGQDWVLRKASLLGFRWPSSPCVFTWPYLGVCLLISSNEN